MNTMHLFQMLHSFDEIVPHLMLLDFEESGSLLFKHFMQLSILYQSYLLDRDFLEVEEAKILSLAML